MPTDGKTPFASSAPAHSDWSRFPRRLAALALPILLHSMIALRIATVARAGVPKVVMIEDFTATW